MGMNMPQTSRSSRSTPVVLAEINVTPLVDVMLVLLIIFMLATPMLNQGLQIDLPKANAGHLNDVPNQLILIIDKSRTIFINDKAIPTGTLRIKLEGIAKANPSVQVFIRADQNLPYGFITQVMAEVKAARINRVGLVTIPPDQELRI